MNKPKVYIAGKITGRPVAEYTKQFNNAERKLNEMGFITFNPVHHVLENTPWWMAMRICIRNLMDCDLICMLPNWTDSKGAVVERLIARIVRIPRLKIFNDESKN